jgi:hypothetical protein
MTAGQNVRKSYCLKHQKPVSRVIGGESCDDFAAIAGEAQGISCQPDSGTQT